MRWGCTVDNRNSGSLNYYDTKQRRFGDKRKRLNGLICLGCGKDKAPAGRKFTREIREKTRN